MLIIAINAQSHSVDATPSPALVGAWRSLVSIWEKAYGLPRPCSQYRSFRSNTYAVLDPSLKLVALISCSTISLAPQFIIWLFWRTWSVMADLWCSLVEALRVDLVKFLAEIFSASFLCSGSQLSPCFTAFSHWFHGILYTTPAFFSWSTLSFGWTKTCRVRVVWGLTTAATLCLVNISCIFSVNEWIYGTVTTPLDFSCALSFLDLSFLIAFLFICSSTLFIAQSG